MKKHLKWSFTYDIIKSMEKATKRIFVRARMSATLENAISPPKIKLFDYKWPEKKFTRTTIFISCLYDPCLGKGKANHENQNLFIRRGSGPKKIGERTHF